MTAHRSATVPTRGQSEADVLDARARAWQSRPLLRAIYHRYFAEMIAHFAAASAGDWGDILELGGGSGNFREYFLDHHPGRGRLIATDIVPTPHVQLAADAMRLPFADASFDNILLQDVLHHLPYPLRFFAEAERVLRPGGRLVMTEPFISPFSHLVFKLTHPEPVDMGANIFPSDPPIKNQNSKIENPPSPPDPPAFTGTGAFASNQAIPTLLFYRDLPRFQQRFPHLRVVARLLRSRFVYPLSGGFSGPQLLPRPLIPAAWMAENLLAPASRLMAFRLVVVLERRKGSDE